MAWHRRSSSVERGAFRDDLPLAMITLQADQLEKVLGIGDLH